MMESFPFLESIDNLKKRKNMPQIKSNKTFQAIALSIFAVGINLISPPSAKAGDWGVVEVTGYSAEEFPGQTASGPTTRKLLSRGGLYVAANGVPFGTHLCADGYGYLGKVVDTIGHSSNVDLLFPTTQQAINWGRKRLRVYTC